MFHREWLAWAWNNVFHHLLSSTSTLVSQEKGGGTDGWLLLKTSSYGNSCSFYQEIQIYWINVYAGEPPFRNCAIMRQLYWKCNGLLEWKTLHKYSKVLISVDYDWLYITTHTKISVNMLSLIFNIIRQTHY